MPSHDHDPVTCSQCDLAGLEAHLQMLLPLEALACDLDAWLRQYAPTLRVCEAEPLRQALRMLCLGVQTIHDRER